MPKFIIGTCPPHCTDSHGASPTNPGLELWGGLTFSASPIIHKTLTSVQREANRLAQVYPDKAFVIFRAIEARKTNPHPIVVESFK